VLALLAAGTLAILLLRQKIKDHNLFDSYETDGTGRSPTSPSLNARKSNVPTVPDANMNTTWLEGVWEGTAYQLNTRSTWTLRLTAQSGMYFIEYPSLSCGGKWTIVERDFNSTKFKEKLLYGLNRCVDNGYVAIERLSSSQIAFKYTEPNSSVIAATAVLNKK